VFVSSGPHIYVGDFGNHRIQIFEKANGNYLGQFGCKGTYVYYKICR
jgi:hypothetical protein